MRSETALGEGAVSVSFAAVSLARKIFGRLDGRRVLVVGAGEISALTAQHLRSQGVEEIVITSRTAAHADALAAEVGGRSVPWANLRQAMGNADIVLTATGSQRPIIVREDVERVLGRKRAEPLFIIDVAVPRDVDPAVSEIEQVFLYNVDDLQSIVQENLARRGAEITRAEAIVDEEALAVHGMAAIAASHSHGRGACGRDSKTSALAELRRLDSRLSGLPPETRARDRRGHQAHRRKAAARADRTAQGAAGRGDPGRLY